MNSNNKSFGCCGSSSSCGQLGPFIAVDNNCVTPTPPVALTTGSIIPFSSGTVAAVLTSLVTGLVGTSTMVGFGSSIPGINILGGTITVPGLSEAFSVPRVGNITAIAASFTETLGLTILGTATIHATIFRAPAGSNTFTATAATVDLSPLTGVIAIGNTVDGATSAFTPVPVAVGDRLLMVFSVTAEGLGGLINVVTGGASAGITIA